MIAWGWIGAIGAGAVAAEPLAAEQPSTAPTAPAAAAAARPWPEFEARFKTDKLWSGGDGAYSVELPSGKALWLFSDTWVGEIKEGRRTGTLVNNTVGVQEGTGADARITFHIRRDDAGRPRAVFTPSDGRGWYWLFAGVIDAERLCVFLPRFEKAGDGGAFGFRQVGLSLGVVANPTEPPTKWKIEDRAFPFVDLDEKKRFSFGAAILRRDNELFVYGCQETPARFGPRRGLLVARVPAGSMTDFERWRFFDGREWVADFRRAAPLASGLGSEFSVTWLEGPRRFVCVTTAGGLSREIVAHSADQPWGPWSAAIQLYSCPDVDWDKRIFCYAAKAHPHLGGRDELAISYVANSFEFSHVGADTRLYWPRFIRVPWPVKPTR